MNYKISKNGLYSYRFVGIAATVILFSSVQEIWGGGDQDCAHQRMVLPTIGDSNGEGAGKWPDQLQQQLQKEP
jgi:hypothetical protein